MKGLLDTHTFLWGASDPSKVSAAALAFLNDPANEVFLSVVSAWEIVIKQQIGKLPTTPSAQALLAQYQATGGRILDVTLDHVLAVEGLPTPHKDPFDRLLIAQAIVEGATLLSADPTFAQYPVTVLW